MTPIEEIMTDDELFNVEVENEALLMAAADTLAAKQHETKMARDHFVSLLPVASDAQVSALSYLVSAEGKIPAGLRPNVDFRLSAEQEKTLRAVKAARVKWCKAHKLTALADVAGDEHELVSYKVRVGTEKVRRVLTFDHQVGKKRTGLIDRLRAGFGKSA